MKKILFVGLLMSVLGAGCLKADTIVLKPIDLTPKREAVMTLTSTAFSHLGNLPVDYTCDGKGINPPLDIGDIPQDAASLALIMHDPDASANGFVHWVLYNMRANVDHIQQGIEPNATIGKNGAGTQTYQPACPPSGNHHYIFDVYALDSVIDLPDGATQDQVLQAITGHILEKTQLVARYQRK